MLNRETASEYDLANRPLKIVTRQGDLHVYTGSVGYDEYNNLSCFTEKVSTILAYYRTGFTYDRENKPTGLSYSDGNSLAYTYDGIGRMNKRTMTVGNHAYEPGFTYVAGSNGGNTTALVAAMSQTGENLSYTYTNTGNIASVTRAGVTTSYAYDATGQLIRVNDPWDKTSGTDGTTWTWAYDRGGNILNRKRYAYTTGTLGSALQTITYTYGNADWKDQLTAYNGAAITYESRWYRWQLYQMATFQF